MRVGPRLLVVVAALAALAIGQVAWWVVRWPDGLAPAGSAGVAGGAGTGGLAGVLPAVALAAMLLTLTLGRAGRRVVGLLTALVGGGITALGLGSPQPPAGVVEQALQAATLSPEWTIAATWAPAGYGVAGLALVAASVWLVVSPPGPRRPTTADAGEALADSRASWKAMDHGLDPTDHEGERP